MENAALGRRLLLAYHCRGNGNGRFCTALGTWHVNKKETVLFPIYLPLAGDAFYGAAVAFVLCCAVCVYVPEKQGAKCSRKVKEIYRLIF